MPNPNQAPPPIDTIAAVPALRTLGTGAKQAAAGNDSRFGTPTNAQLTPAASKIPLADINGFIDSRWLSFGINVKDFGAVGDGVADDSAAIQAALDFTTISSGYAQGRKVRIPEGRYKLGTTLYMRRQISLEGETGGGFFSASVLLPVKNITALQIDFQNLVEAPERRGSSSTVENLRIQYPGSLPRIWQSSTAYSVGDLVVSQPGADDFAGQSRNPKVSNFYTMECTVAGTTGSSTPDWDGTTPLTNGQGSLTFAEGATISDGSVTWTVRMLAGIRMHTGAKLKNIWIDGSPGNGILVAASVGWNPYANVNGFFITDCVANGGAMHGLYVQGSDANAGNVHGFLGISNRRWGIYDHSFLGNTYVGCNCSTNVDLRGVTSISRSGHTVTVTMELEHGLLPGNIVGQWGEPDANFPGGRWPVIATPTAKQFTYYQAGPAVSGVGVFLFMIGGGAYKTFDFNARNVFTGCYSESDQFGSEFASPTQVNGGLHAAGFKDGGSTAPTWLDGIFSTAGGTAFLDFRNSANPKRTFTQLAFADYAIHFSSASEGAKFAISSLTRTSNVVTAVTTSPHGFVVNEDRYVTAINDPNFAGGLKTILTVPTATSFTYIESGADSSGIAGHYALGNGGGTGFTFADNGPTNFEGWWCWRHANLDERMFMCWSGNLADVGPGVLWFPQGFRLGGAGGYQCLLEFSTGVPTWSAPTQRAGSLRFEGTNYPQVDSKHGIFGYQFINDGIGTGVQTLRHTAFGFSNQIDVTNGVGSPYATDWKQHAGCVFTNEGATAKVYLTLQQSTGFPDLRGTEYNFYVKDSDGMRIVAPSSRRIRWGVNVTADAGYIESTTVGSWIKLKLVGTYTDPEWQVIASAGIWTDGTFVISSSSTNVINETTSQTITTSQSGTLFTNIGAAGTVIMTLPAAAEGLKYRFACVAAFTLSVLAVGSDVIYNGTESSTAAGTVSSNTVTSTIELVGVSGGKWLAFGPTGLWATA